VISFLLFFIFYFVIAKNINKYFEHYIYDKHSFFLKKTFLLLSFLGSHHVAQASLEFAVLLPQSPKCWIYRHCTTMPEKKILLGEDY
jgi:hypothetical protein